MDPIRQFRAVIPPFLLFLSLGLGIYFDHQATGSGGLRIPSAWDNLVTWVGDLKCRGVQVDLIAVAAALVAVSLPLGFLIGGIVHFVLTLLFIVFRLLCPRLLDRLIGLHYEITIGWKDFDAICTTIRRFPPSPGCSREARRKQLRYVLPYIAMYDHGYLYQEERGIHEWNGRRWTASITSINSCVVLLVAHWLGWLLLGIRATWSWWIVTAALVTCLGSHAMLARWQNARQLQAQLGTLRKRRGFACPLRHFRIRHPRCRSAIEWLNRLLRVLLW